MKASSKERSTLNHTRITISVMLAVVCACVAANGQTASSGSKPQIQSITSPSFNPTNYAKIAIVLSNPLKPTPADNSQRSIDDEFTFALVQKGYDVVTPSDTQSLLTNQPAANPPASAEP